MERLIGTHSTEEAMVIVNHNLMTLPTATWQPCVGR